MRTVSFLLRVRHAITYGLVYDEAMAVNREALGRPNPLGRVDFNALASEPRGRVFPGGKLDTNAIIRRLAFYPDLHDLPPRLRDVPPSEATPQIKTNGMYPLHIDLPKIRDGGEDSD